MGAAAYMTCCTRIRSDGQFDCEFSSLVSLSVMSMESFLSASRVMVRTFLMCFDCFLLSTSMSNFLFSLSHVSVLDRSSSCSFSQRPSTSSKLCLFYFWV